MRKYDFIFSVGAACSSTQTLRASDLQRFSNPLDWLYGNDFEGRINLILSHFERFIQKIDLEYLNLCNGDVHNLCGIYHNKFNDITFNHDFQYGVPLEESYNKVKEKYDRRIARLYASIKSAQRILIGYLETPNTAEKLPNNDILISCLQKIKAQYPEKEFNLLYFTNDSHFEPLQYKEEHLSNEIIKVTGNYKDLNKGAPDYTVNLKFFKRYYSQYSLNSSLQYKLKRFFTKIFVKSIPVKSVRRRLKTKYHV